MLSLANAIKKNLYRVDGKLKSHLEWLINVDNIIQGKKQMDQVCVFFTPYH